MACRMRKEFHAVRLVEGKNKRKRKRAFCLMPVEDAMLHETERPWWNQNVPWYILYIRCIPHLGLGACQRQLLVAHLDDEIAFFKYPLSVCTYVCKVLGRQLE